MPTIYHRYHKIYNDSLKSPDPDEAPNNSKQRQLVIPLNSLFSRRLNPRQLELFVNKFYIWSTETMLLLFVSMKLKTLTLRMFGHTVNTYNADINKNN